MRVKGWCFILATNSFIRLYQILNYKHFNYVFIPFYFFYSHSCAFVAGIGNSGSYAEIQR